MESLQCDIHMTAEHVIVSKGPWSLWCSRSDGSLKPGSVVTPGNLESAHYLGKCYGLVGKIQFFSGGEWKLLLIGSIRSVGVLPLCGKVYCIQRLIVIPLTTDDPSPDILGLENQKDSPPGGGGGGGGGGGRKGTGRQDGGGIGSSGRLRDLRDKDKLERRLMDALLRMFNDSQSFYFSPDGDLTHTQQRKVDQGSGSLSNSFSSSSSSSSSSTSDLSIWNAVDERFFWNKWMLQDLLDISSVLQYSSSARSLVEPWIVPVVQGYVEIHTLLVHSSNPPNHIQNSLKQNDRGGGGGGEVVGGGGGGGGESELEGGDEQETAIEEEQEDMIVFSPIPDVSSSGDGQNQGIRSKGEHSGRRGEVLEWDNSGNPNRGNEAFPIPHIKEVKCPDDDDDRNNCVFETEKGSQLNEEMLSEVKSSPPEGVREMGKKLLDRLKLTRRSISPDRGGRGGGAGAGGEVGEKGEMMAMGTRRGLPGERLEMVESGEVEGETGGEGEKEREAEKEEERKTEDYSFKLALVSRRSRHRAGTRYRRRGVDAMGKVANFVETEMILQAGSHHASYVLVRGSVPVFWTQPGTKYRPPPVIERGEEETQEAFVKHFEEQFYLYNDVAITSLINQSGRESVLGQAFEKHVLSLDSPHITHITFDFHRHFKADQTGAIQRLVTATQSLNKKFRFCWLDTNISSGPLCRQDGVFRVNCMDCLDRTNVVQTAFCKEVLQSVLQKLGIIPFDEQLSGAMLTTYKLMWANNGDFISRQYTGTDAMKGDLTRYGERKFSGMMKDGYNSAHRYYQNLFRDSYRQVLIDLMQGVPHSDAFYSLPVSLRGRRGEEEEDEEDEEEELWSLDREQAIAEMVRFCREELFPTKTLTVVGWALVEAAGYSFVESSRKEEDCVLLQCLEQNQLCMASYNVEDDQVNCFIRIPMQKVEKIVIGPLGTILRSSQKRLHMRLYYTLMDSKQCYFTLKTVNFISMDEDRDILLGIATTLSNLCPTILVQEQKLTKKRSPTHLGVIHLVVPKDMAMEEWGIMTTGLSSPSRTTNGQVQREEQEGEGVAESGGEEHGVYEEQEDEDERELSFSVPASPTLTRRHPSPAPPPHPAHRRVQRLRSQSFDDIISSINNEEVDDDNELLSPLSVATSGQQDPTSSVSARNLIFSTSPQHPPSHRLDSRSDSSTENLPRTGLGIAYDHTHLVSSQPEMVATTMGERSTSRSGRLNQLKGKLLGRKVRSSNRAQTNQSTEVPLQLMKLNSDDVISDTSNDSSRKGDLGTIDDPPVIEDTPTTDPSSSSSSSSSQMKQSQQVSQVAHRLMAVGQRFKNAPPSLLRRMGVVSGSGLSNHVTQATPTDQQNEIDGSRTHDARNLSKTNFITL